MIREEFSGGRPWASYYSHGDPFPLPPSWIESCLESEGAPFPQRGLWSAKALNNLALHEPNTDFDVLLHGKKPNVPQKHVARRLVSAFREAGPRPDDLDGVAALGELAASQDLYHDEPLNLAPYDFDKVKVLHICQSGVSGASLCAGHFAKI